MTDITWLINQARSDEQDLSQRQAAFGELVKQHQQMAHRTAYRVLQDGQLANDVSQEAFIVAYKKLAQLREPEAFPGWLRQIVLTQCNRQLRGKRLPTIPMDGVKDIPSDAPDPTDVVEDRDLKAAILAAIAALPEHEQAVIELFYLQGYSLKETARTLQLPITTIKKRLQYARRRLKEHLIEAKGTNLALAQAHFNSSTDHLVAFILTFLSEYELIETHLMPQYNVLPQPALVLDDMVDLRYDQVNP